MENKLLVFVLFISASNGFLRVGSSLCRGSLRMSHSVPDSNAQQQLGIVTMYKKNGCPHCAAAIQLLEGTYGLSIRYVDIESENREEILYQ